MAHMGESADWHANPAKLDRAEEAECGATPAFELEHRLNLLQKSSARRLTRFRRISRASGSIGSYAKRPKQDV